MEQNLKHFNNGNMTYDNVPDGAAAVGGGMQQKSDVMPYAHLEKGLKEFFGEEFSMGDPASQNALLGYLEQAGAQNERLAGLLERDPRLAQMFIDIAEGKRNAHSAVARYYGRSLMDVDESRLEAIYGLCTRYTEEMQANIKVIKTTAFFQHTEAEFCLYMF